MSPYLSATVGIAAMLLNLCALYKSLPLVRKEHQMYQRSRLATTGWTLPWWLCGLWWFGLENLAPKFLRKEAHHA